MLVSENVKVSIIKIRTVVTGMGSRKERLVIGEHRQLLGWTMRIVQIFYS